MHLTTSSTGNKNEWTTNQSPLKPERERSHYNGCDRVTIDDEDIVAHSLTQRRDGDEEHPGEAELEEDHGHVRLQLPPYPGKFHVITLPAP